jgi:hypothetical protein
MPYLEQTSILAKILNIILTFLLVILLIVTSYYLYLNIPSPIEDLKINLNQPSSQSPILSKSNQFYPNMKFNHNTITYGINQDCSQEQKERIVNAFTEIHNKVPILRFLSSFSSSDIEITCSEGKKPDTNTDGKKYFIAGEGGAKEIIQSGDYHLITEGVVYLFKENKNAKKCSYPNIEVHEILHVLGFDHNENPSSIMYPFLTDCNQTLDQSIIDELNRLYSINNLPDLTFKNFTATKSGRYLNFNLTIRNSGSITSKPFLLTILDNEDIVETREIKKIEFGAGITLSTTNLKLKRKNPDKIQFILDQEDKIKEFDETNNIAEIKLN